jgi:hypothetical protein
MPEDGVIDLSSPTARKAYQQQLLRDLVANREALQKIAAIEVESDNPQMLAQKRLAIKEVKEQSEVIIQLLKDIDG